MSEPIEVTVRKVVVMPVNGRGPLIATALIVLLLLSVPSSAAPSAPGETSGKLGSLPTGLGVAYEW